MIIKIMMKITHGILISTYLIMISRLDNETMNIYAHNSILSIYIYIIVLSLSDLEIIKISVMPYINDF